MVRTTIYIYIYTGVVVVLQIFRENKVETCMAYINLRYNTLGYTETCKWCFYQHQSRSQASMMRRQRIPSSLFVACSRLARETHPQLCTRQPLLVDKIQTWFSRRHPFTKLECMCACAPIRCASRRNRRNLLTTDLILFHPCVIDPCPQNVESEGSQSDGLWYPIKGVYKYRQ